MNAQQWSQVKNLFETVLDLPESERDVWLREQPDVASEVRKEVTRLLAHASCPGFLDSDPPPASPLQEDLIRSLEPGQLLCERFEVIGLVGIGGMGEVYRAFDNDTDQVVALKTIRGKFSQQPDLLKRLRREVHLARKLTHTSLCKIYDIHYAAGRSGQVLVFLSMEFLEGETLELAIQQQKFTADQAWPIVQQLANALDASHAAGVIHRDLKASNVILVDESGKPIRAVITDFGLSKESDADAHSAIMESAVNSFVGTPAYMSPEQLRSQPATELSDIYSFGVILFQMVTGKLPFTGDTALAVSLRKLEQEPPSPATLVKNLPEPWTRTILACLSKDPEQRPQSGAAILDGLRGSHHGMRAPRITRRRALITGIAASIAGVSAAWLVSRRGLQISPEAQRHYKLGEEFARRRNSESIQNAIREFNQALELQNNYADAWAGLADAYAGGLHYGYLDPGDARTRARDAAQAALRYNPRLAKAQGALAYTSSIDLQRWRQAEPYFKRAIELDPNEPLTRSWYAAFLGRQGRGSEAIEQARKAVLLDPAGFYPNTQLAQEYFRARRFSEFYQQAADVVRLHPFEASAHLSLARAFEWQGKYDDALKECDEAVKYRNSPVAKCTRATIEGRRGNIKVAAKLAEEVEAYWREKPFESNILAQLYASLGNTPKVVDVLEAGYKRGDATILACATSPYLERINDDPRLKAFWKRLGY